MTTASTHPDLTTSGYYVPVDGVPLPWWDSRVPADRVKPGGLTARERETARRKKEARHAQRRAQAFSIPPRHADIRELMNKKGGRVA